MAYRLTQETLDSLTWHIPRRHQNQIVERSFAIDAECGIVIQRIYDQSDRSESYEVGELHPDAEWEPWNFEPSVSDWRPATVHA